MHNLLKFSGQVTALEFSHDFRGERFFRYTVRVPRLSGTEDFLPLVVSEKLLFGNDVVPGMFISTEGQIRTRNEKGVDGKNHLIVFGFANDIKPITQDVFDTIDVRNDFQLEGYVCKAPRHRETATGRIITDLLIACNRQHAKSDYIPCIVWGANAKMAKNFVAGDKINLVGRFQSRLFKRKTDETVGIVYEVSVAEIELEESCERSA